MVQSAKIDKRELTSTSYNKLRLICIKHFARDGFDKANIRDMAAEAGVSPKTIYKYFGNKENCLLECIRPELEYLVKTCTAAANSYDTVLDQAIAYSSSYFDFYFKNPDVAKIVVMQVHQSKWMSNQQTNSQTIHALAHRRSLEGQLNNEVWDEVSSELLVEAFLGAGVRLLIMWLLDPSEDEEILKEEYFAIVKKLLTP